MMNARLWSIAATLLLLGASSVATAAGFSLARTDTDARLLPADRAFELLPVERQGDRVQLQWVIAPGYFLYRDRIRVEPAQANGAVVGTLQLPPAEQYDEAGLGTVAIYRGDLHATLRLPQNAQGVQRLRVRFQGCADQGVCYPPQERVIDIGGSSQ